MYLWPDEPSLAAPEGVGATLEMVGVSSMRQDAGESGRFSTVLPSGGRVACRQARVMVVTAVSDVRGKLVEQDPKSYSSKQLVVGLPGLRVEALDEHRAGATRHALMLTRQLVARCGTGNFYHRILKPTVQKRFQPCSNGHGWHGLRFPVWRC